jgi:hypothetical protein
VQRRLLAGRRNRQPRNARRKSIRRRDERALSKPAVARARARKNCAQQRRQQLLQDPALLGRVAITARTQGSACGARGPT